MAAANEQRRAVERRLHDGVQQDLIALAVKLQLAGEVAGRDPAALKRLLGELRQDVHDAIEEVRSLAHGVYPPVLVDLGIAAALRGAATAAGVPVQVEAPGDRFPADVEAAVYFCSLEALQAIAPAGSNGRPTLRVWRDDAWLRFKVDFEGNATVRDKNELGAVATRMNDRVGALGGTLTVVADAQGARVEAALPLDDS